MRGNPDRLHRGAALNFSVAETKTRLGRLIDRLDERFGHADPSSPHLRLPPTVAQHWAATLASRGTTSRDEGGVRRQAYDIFVRGSLGPDPAIGKPLFRRVPTDELDAAVEGLIQGWLDGRSEGESFVTFARRSSDQELGSARGSRAQRGTATGPEEAA